MEKLWYITIFYSHIESYKHLIWNHMKDRKVKCFFDTILGTQNLDDSSMDSWMWQSPEIGTAMKHKDGTVFLDVPAPANGRRYVPRNPTRADRSLCATPE